MGTINRVILIGRLGRNPEDRMTAGGTHVSNFSLATDTNHAGDKDKTTQWHRIVAFGKTAEQCNLYLHKGRLVCIEGELQTHSWEKPAGEKHYSTEVVASRVTFLDPKNQPAPPTEAVSGSDL